MRVHELAKELRLSSKDLLDSIHALGVDVKSHMSKLTDEDADQIRNLLSDKSSDTTTTAEPAPEPQPEAAEPAPAPEPEPAAAPAPSMEEAPPAPVEIEEEQPSDRKVIRIRGAVIVKELADMLEMPPNRVIADLMKFKLMASINQRVEPAVVKKLAEMHGFEFEHEKRGAEHPAPSKKKEEDDEPDEDRPEDLLPRAPVVTFLGHVDHGKTSLLDHVRKTTVAAGESGGITQHIGAYTVDVGGNLITFLDTPGHAAFTAMRARGANLTDIAVIIIAADDGIMPQTKEAISHAKAAGVQIMVAINKIDLATANVDRVRQQLQAEGLQPEDWGGETICCPVSAATGEGIDHLLEMILLQSELLELKSNPRRRASGYVVEAQLEPGMGPTVNLLVTRGTLKVGDSILCDRYSGRVRALISDHGVKVKSAGPSTPVKCLGLAGVPEAGSAFQVCLNDRRAKTLAQEAALLAKEQALTTPKKTSLESLFSQLKEDEKLELKIILKADTQGSVEAITHSLNEIPSDKIAMNIVLGGTGNITVNDVMLASASDAIVLGFHVSKEPGVDHTAKHEGVQVRLHDVIYELIDQVRDGMAGLLEPNYEERVRGRAHVKQVFVLTKRGRVAGCMVTSGHVRPSYRVRVIRRDEVLAEGRMDSLRHFQDEVAEVREAQECGIRLPKSMDFAEGDILEFYELEEVKQTL